MPDPDLEKRGGEGGGHPDPEIRGGEPRSPKFYFRPFGPQFGLKIRVSGGGHDSCIPSTSISLFSVICFELQITRTRTFFDFPRSFELSGVHCNFCSNDKN